MIANRHPQEAHWLLRQHPPVRPSLDEIADHCERIAGRSHRRQALNSLGLRMAQPRHQAAGRAVIHALTSGEPDAWCAAAAVIEMRLTARERVMLAFAALLRLPEVDAARAFQAAQPCAGAPPPPFADLMAAARLWAAAATRRELRAHLWATWQALGAEDRAAFLRRVTSGRARA